MLECPTDSNYPLDEENWGLTFDPRVLEHRTTPNVNNHVALTMWRYGRMGYKDLDMWEEFRESFEGWSLEILELGDRIALKELRTYLVTHGV